MSATGGGSAVPPTSARSAFGPEAAAKMTTMFVKRLQKEIQTAQKEQDSPAFDGDVLMSFDPANSQSLHAACIGLCGTPFEGAFLAFSVTLPPNFAMEPPKVQKLVWSSGLRLHPNIYANGKVCMDIINTYGSQQWVSDGGVVWLI
jgi:ubiquitin-protein ligase